jgi:hypothetical protein
VRSIWFEPICNQASRKNLQLCCISISSISGEEILPDLAHSQVLTTDDVDNNINIKEWRPRQELNKCLYGENNINIISRYFDFRRLCNCFC